MMDSVLVLRLFHVQHTAEFSDFIGLPSDHMHYFFILLVGLNKQMQSSLFTGWQRSDDKQLRRFEDQFLQQFPLELYLLPILRSLMLLKSSKEYVSFHSIGNERDYYTINYIFRSSCRC